MLTLRCTQKALKMLGLAATEPARGGVGRTTEWFASAATIDHRKCILFVHKETFYGFWVTGVRRRMLKDLHGVVLEHLSRRLRLDRLPVAWARVLGLGDGELHVAKTNDQRIVASLTHHIRDSKWFIAREGGLAWTSIDDLNAQLNETPMGVLEPGAVFPIAALREQMKLRATPASAKNR